MNNETLEMENAALKELLQEIGNELLMADDDGKFYAEKEQSSFMHHLADKLNKIIL